MGGTTSLSREPNNPMDERIRNEKDKIAKQKKAEEKRKKELNKRKKAEAKALKKNTKKGKPKKPKDLDNFVQPPITPAPPPRALIHETDRDVIIKTKLLKQLDNDSETFILNQLLLSIEFFLNYQRDLQEATRLNHIRQLEESKKLFEYNKRVLILDRIIEVMEKRIVFGFRHGENKEKRLQLQRSTKYIIHENIEIIKQSEYSNNIYSTVDDQRRPSLRIIIDNDEKFNKVDNKEHVGFYRLRHCEIVTVNTFGPHDRFEDDEDDDDDDDDDDEKDEDEEIVRKIRDSIAVQKPKDRQKIQQVLMKNNQQPSMTVRASNSSASPSSSEYDYTYIQNINSHRPLNEMGAGNSADEPLNAVTIPQSCFINVKMKTEEDDDDDSFIKKTIQIKQSFHSKMFFAHFTKVFKHIIASNLGYGTEEVPKATWKGASIFIGTNEIVPAIQTEWPEQVAFEWETRYRLEVKSSVSGKYHQWPPKEVIKKVINKRCYIIPNGYAPKDGTNPEREFEWQIVFPAAEQYLESCLSQQQLKIYVLFKVLIKTFIEPIIGDKYNLTDHIRHHLFWQFEQQYPSMSDEFLGEHLIHILNSLLQRIGKTMLPDYFLPKRNLLFDIPSKVLIDVHENLYRITESPVRHLIIALRNLHVIGKPFYPTLKYKHVYESLTLDALAMLNPHLSSHQKKPPKPKVPSDDEDDNDGITAIGVIGLSERTAKNDIKVKGVRFNDKPQRKRKDSTESILDFQIERRMDQQRRQVIFEIFIPHYISMAKASANFSAFDQSLRYLKQVERLCSILADDRYDKLSLYLEQVQEIRQKVVKAQEGQIREQPSGPALPRRESLLDKHRRVTITQKSATIHEAEDDPYTNIETIRNSTAIQPADFSDSDDDYPTPQTNGVPNGIIKNGPRKSILTNGNHNHRPNGIIIETVQIHTPRRPSIEKSEADDVGSKTNKNNSSNNPKKATVNIANRRKSSTKMVKIANGHVEDINEESDEAENTSF